jgi:hypothetical protein
MENGNASSKKARAWAYLSLDGRFILYHFAC